MLAPRVRIARIKSSETPTGRGCASNGRATKRPDCKATRPVEHTIYFYSALVGCTFVGLQVIMQVFGFFDDVEVGDTDVHTETGEDPGHDSSVFFGILSFKALCAFAGIFGLTGLLMLRGESPMEVRVLAACAAGIAAMFGVAWMMRGLSRLHSSGTVQISNAAGLNGTVYLRVPGKNAGIGKVTIDIQGRSMECAAVTDGDEIATGARVKVVSVDGGETLKVIPL